MRPTSLASEGWSPTAYAGGVVDLRLFQPRLRLGLVDQTLTALKADEDVLLVFHEPPDRLLGYLHQQYGARLVIQPVDEGPEVWSLRVRVVSPPEGDSSGPNR
ncbi:DUF2249 domain-containing protein [Spiribacter sp. 2438]|nr:DUF2249 domain-containing protein [Spiribacter sp. 2438]